MQIHRKFLYFLPLALLILLSACSNSMESSAEVALPLQTMETVLFQDDFSNPKSGWDRASRGGNSTYYADGQYRITLAAPQQDIWANPYQAFDQDINVEVDAWQNPSSVKAAFGVICGYSDVNNFYALTVGSGGYVEIFQYQQGKRLTLTSAEAAATVEPERNHLVAECSSSQLSLWVNGSLAAQVQPVEFTYGDVGLIASSFDETPVEFYFDNFVVKAAASSIEP